MFAVKAATDSKKQKSDQNKKAKISCQQKTRLTARKKSNEKTTEMRKKVVAEKWKRAGGG